MAISGKKTVTTAGTQVPLGSGSICGPVLVKALAGNTGFIYIGDSAVSSTTGLELDASEEIKFDYVDRLDNIYVDSSVNGEGVTWLILKA